MLLTKKEKECIMSELSKINSDIEFDKGNMFEFYISNDLIVIFESLIRTIRTKKVLNKKDDEDLECLASTIDSITFLQEKYLG